MGPQMGQGEDVLGKRAWEGKQYSQLASVKWKGEQRESRSGGAFKTKSGAGPGNQPSAGHQAAASHSGPLPLTKSPH